MISTTTFYNLVTIAVIGSVLFSVFHAKDVSAASAVMNPSFSTNNQLARGVENAIHLDFHTHVDRQPLSNLLQNMQNDKPLTGDRSLRKAYNIADKKQFKLRDGAFGQHQPEIV